MDSILIVIFKSEPINIMWISRKWQKNKSIDTLISDSAIQLPSDLDSWLLVCIMKGLFGRVSVWYRR